MTQLPENFIFTQTNLQDYVDCDRRFELRYIERVRYPAPQAEPMLLQEQRMRMGDRFHRFVHQYLIGIPADNIRRMIDDEAMLNWWDQFIAWGMPDIPAWRLPERVLSVPLGDYRLLAKFDMLAYEPGGQIVVADWKTTRKLPPQKWLADRLQTRVYRYVAVTGAEQLYGGPVPPEQVTMLYWFAETGDQVRLNYDRAQYDADAEYLTGLVSRMSAQQQFPLTDDLKHCKYCTYRGLCDRGVRAGDVDEIEEDIGDMEPDAFLVDFDQIAEVDF